MDLNKTIILQNFAVAFLKRDDSYLLMKRSPERKVAPGVWSCVGGHIEPHESSDPLSACLREIQEETGISKNRIYDLTLRYILIRRTKDIIRQNYIFFGETDVSDFTDTEEGTLHWIPAAELLDREFSKTYDAMLRHYINTPDEKKRVVVGIAESIDGEIQLNWSIMDDFEK